MAIARSDFERLMRTKKKHKVTAVQLNVPLDELKDESAAIVLRGTFEDSLYRMYLGGAIKAIGSPEDEVTSLELCAFILGKRDQKRVFMGESDYMTRSQLIEKVFTMCEYDIGPPATAIEEPEEEDERESMPPPVVPDPADEAKGVLDVHAEVLENMADKSCPICSGPSGEHKMSCPNRPDGQVKLPVKRRKRKPKPVSKMKYAKPETIGPDSPMARFVQQWWGEYNGQPVAPNVLRTMAEQYEITWPENQMIPPGLRNEFVDISDTLIVKVDRANEHMDWLLLTSQHFDDKGHLIEETQ